MTIRDTQKYLDNLWDWGFLDECFAPSRIKVTDLDGVVERRGHFLLIETKLPGNAVPQGQSILFNALQATGRWHIVIVWGKRNQPESIQVWGNDKRPVNEQQIKSWVSRWFKWADATP